MNLRTFLFLFGISFYCQQSMGQDTKPDKRFSGLDTAFARVLQNWHDAGFAVAVIEKDRVIYAKGFGYRNLENKLPVTPNSLFAIGSCTKAFTASLLGMFRQEGKLDFDKPVRTYLPELKFYKNEMNENISLRDMMCHRTGLPRHDFSWYFFTSSSRDSLIQRIQYLEPSAGVREKWQYNNFMFLAQGVLAEKLSGKTWEQNVREKIFLPLNMTHSVFSIEDLLRSEEPATGYSVKKDSIIKKTAYFHIDAMGPAGSINSSVLDMSKWVITWIHGGKYMGKEIIPASYVNEAISSQMIVGAGLPDKEKKDLYFSNYGFGWFLASYRGHYRVEHGGNIDGFSANTCFFPSDSIGIIVLTNQESSTVPAIVRNLIADRLLSLKYLDWNSDLKNTVEKEKAAAKEVEKASSSNRKPNATPTHELKAYTGLYTNPGYGTIEINLTNDSLFALVGKHIWWLRPHFYDVFDPYEKDPEEGIDTTEKSNPIQFQMNIAGDIESAMLNLEPSLKPLLFTRAVKAKNISRDSLQPYTGEYVLGSTTIQITIKNEKTLFLLVPGQPEYKLIPVDKNKFEIKSLSGYSIQFNKNDKNEVIELLAIQPNGTFKATKKK
jgi:CubicO group peptidase (beta-lactamase class C family)